MEETKKEKLINDFTQKKVRLSYSTLKNFTSPINLINYKLKKFIKTPSMVFGSLCDVLLLTPQNFTKEFKIIEKVPTTDMQISFCDDLIFNIKRSGELSEETIRDIFSQHYSRGDAMKTFAPLKDYVDGTVNGFELITQEIYDEAILITGNLMNKNDIQNLFSQLKGVQTKVEWEDKGWKFLGYLDMLLDNHIIDLKFSKDSNPEKFERDIANFNYFLQAAMYCKATVEMGICNNPKYSFIVYDKSLNYSIIELDYSYLKYGEKCLISL